jgi:hypothetical protein
MPVIDVRAASAREHELPQVQIPATNAGVLAELPNLKRTAHGQQYVSALVVNGATAYVELLDNTGRVVRVEAGQPWDADLRSTGPDGAVGVDWLAVRPSANITAGQVTVTPTVKEP